MTELMPVIQKIASDLVKSGQKPCVAIMREQVFAAMNYEEAHNILAEWGAKVPIYKKTGYRPNDWWGRE